MTWRDTVIDSPNLDDLDKSFTESLLLRSAMPSDAPFILHSWLQSFRDGDMVEGIPNQIYYHHHHKLVSNLLRRCAVTVLSDPSAPEVIFGWFCWESCEKGIIIHYAYVKNEFRKSRLASRILEAILDSEEPEYVFVTHRVNPMGYEFKKRKWIYNPYLLFKEVVL